LTANLDNAHTPSALALAPSPHLESAAGVEPGFQFRQDLRLRQTSRDIAGRCRLNEQDGSLARMRREDVAEPEGVPAPRDLGKPALHDAGNPPCRSQSRQASRSRAHPPSLCLMSAKIRSTVSWSRRALTRSSRSFRRPASPHWISRGKSAAMLYSQAK